MPSDRSASDRSLSEPRATAGVAVGIFAKAPLPGRVKTRLAPALGEEGAARLYAAFLADTLAAHPDATVFYAAAVDEAWIRARHPHRRLAPQVGADLGERMRAALAALGPGPAVVIGSDLPTLPRSRVADAARALAGGADVALGPASDGGYYLLAARRPLPSLAGVRFSTRHALADTLRALEGLSVAHLAPWYDVDVPEDLRLLRAHLALDPAAAPATHSALFDPDTSGE